MSTPDAICGHDREAMRWALARQEPKPNTGIHVAGAPSTWWRLYEAVTKDNVKLAEIITELVRLLGYKVGGYDHHSADVKVDWYSECDDPPLPKGVAFGYNMQAMWADVRICNGLTMPQARALALYLLDRVEEGVRVEGGFELIARGVELALAVDTALSTSSPFS